MTLYVFDSSSLIVMGHYFPQRFPNFWRAFDSLVAAGQIISAKEVYGELSGTGGQGHLQKWIAENKKIFLAPGAKETAFVAKIFAVPHFQQLVGTRQVLKGTPVADPFVIAMAHVRKGCVVTEEALKPNAAKIPNVCAHFKITCCNLEKFMEQQGWQF